MSMAGVQASVNTTSPCYTNPANSSCAEFSRTDAGGRASGRSPSCTPAPALLHTCACAAAAKPPVGTGTAVVLLLLLQTGTPTSPASARPCPT